MARNLKQINRALVESFINSLPPEIKDSYEKNSAKDRLAQFDIQRYWEKYLFGESVVERLKITDLYKSTTFTTAEVKAFLESPHGKEAILYMLNNIYQDNPKDKLSLFTRLQNDKFGEQIIEKMTVELQTEHDLKARMQSTLESFASETKTRGIMYGLFRKKSPFSTSRHAIHPEKSDAEFQQEIDATVANFERSISNSEETLDLHRKSLLKLHTEGMPYPELVEGVPDIIAPQYYVPNPEDDKKKIKQERKLLANKEEEAKKYIKTLANHIEQELFKRDFQQFIEQKGLKKDHHINHAETKIFEQLFPASARYQEVYDQLQKSLAHGLTEEQKSGSLQCAILRNILSNSNTTKEILTEDSISTMPVIVKKAAIFTNSADLLPSLLTVAGAVTKNALENPSRNTNQAIRAAHLLSNTIQKTSELHKSSLEYTNSFLKYADKGCTTLANRAMMTGIISDAAKLTSSIPLLYYTIESKIALSAKQELIHHVIGDTFDSKLIKSIVIIQETSKNIGLIDEDINLFANLYYGSELKYNVQDGFTKHLKGLIHHIQENKELMLAKARENQLSLIELKVLHGLLIDKPPKSVSANELEMLSTQIQIQSEKLDKAMGLDSLPDGNTYKEYLRTNRLAMNSFAEACFNLARLENVSVMENKKIGFAATKTAFNATSLTVSALAAAGVGGITVAMLPTTLTVADKLSTFVYNTSINPEQEKLEKVGASIHAKTTMHELEYASEKMRTLYELYQLSSKDYPDNILANRKKMILLLKKQELTTIQLSTIRAEIQKNDAEIAILKQKLSSVELGSTEFSLYQEQIDRLLSKNSDLIDKTLNKEQMALEYFDYAVYNMLKAPLIDAISDELKKIKMPETILTTKAAQIQLEQTLAEMQHHLKYADAINTDVIKKDLKSIAKHDGLSSLFDPIVDKIISDLDPQIITSVRANISEYKARTNSMNEEMKLLTVSSASSKSTTSPGDGYRLPPKAPPPPLGSLPPKAPNPPPQKK